MKIFISADIEGVAGINTSDECNPDKPQVTYFREQMSREVAAACEAAITAGAKDILVKDAHWDGLNIDGRALPKCARLVRGWTGHPYGMMAELDDSFDAALFVGYHSRAGSGANPLAHTLNGRLIHEIRLNGVPTSEFRLNTFTATLENVPVAFLSGDEALCDEAKEYNEAIVSFATTKGVGAATVSLHPEVAIEGIYDRVVQALEQDDLREKMRPLPESFELEVDYKITREAYRYSFFPGAQRLADNSIGINSEDYFEILRFLEFVLANGTHPPKVSQST